MKSVVIIIISVCLGSLVLLNAYAETDSRIIYLKSVDIRFNNIETFEVEIDGKSYNFIKLNISVYEPESVFVDLNEFEIHEGGFSDWGTRLIAEHAYDYTDFRNIKEFKDHLGKFTGCNLFLKPANTRGTTYDLNLCYENGLKMNKNYSLKFWLEPSSFKAVSFSIPSEMIQHAVSVLNEKTKQENEKIQEKLKQFEAKNPFKNPVKPTMPQSKDTGKNIPNWIKNNAKWWSEGSLSDSDFVQGIQYLIKQKIVNIPETKTSTGSTDQTIPLWIKSNAGWWARGQISEDDFIKGIQYLVSQGILKVQSSQVTSILPSTTTVEPYSPSTREWIISGPFQIDRSTYAIGEKIFLVIGGLNENEKGQIAFMRPLNDTHYSVYITIPFDGTKKDVFNYYVEPQISKTREICSIDDLMGKWAVVFRGTDYPNLYFEITDNVVPGTDIKSVC